MTNILALPNVSGQFAIVADADWRAAIPFAIAGVAVDLTGILFRLQLRSAAGDPTIWLDLSTLNGGLINGGASGVLSIVAPAAQTRFIPPAAYVADVVAEADAAIVNVCGLAPFGVTVAQGVTIP